MEVLKTPMEKFLACAIVGITTVFVGAWVNDNDGDKVELKQFIQAEIRDLKDQIVFMNNNFSNDIDTMRDDVYNNTKSRIRIEALLSLQKSPNQLGNNDILFMKNKQN